MKNLLLAFLLGAAGCSSPSANNAPQESAGAVMPSDSIEPGHVLPNSERAAIAEEGLTLGRYNDLETGFTYAQAVAALGGEGTEISSSDIGGTKTVMYQWQEGRGGTVNAMFQNGALISKAQAGLE